MSLASRTMVALALLSFAGCRSAQPAAREKPGAKEIAQSRDAVRAAMNWEADVTATDGSQQRSVLVEKVQCPSRRDLMWTSQPPRQVLDNDGRVVIHDVWYDGTWYTSDGRVWNTYRGAEAKLPGKLAIGCGDGPTMVSGGTLSKVLDDVIRNGEIHAGPKMTENSYDCTWYDLSSKPGEPPQYTVCINEPSHLPQVVRSRENGNEYTYTLSQWNSASVGLPPELL